MRAVFSIFFTDAGLNAEEIRIGTVDAFPQGNTDLGYGDFAGVADGKKVLAFGIVIATLPFVNAFKIAENTATHKNMGLLCRIILDLIEVFVNPVDTVSAVYHA